MSQHSNISQDDKRAQKTLVTDLKGEVGPHTWQCYTDQFLGMITPSRYAKEVKLADLEHCIKALSVPSIPTTTGPERSTYVSLAQFLNECVQTAKDAIDQSGIRTAGQNALLFNLTFLPWDKQMGDGVQRSDRLKPDIIAVNSQNGDPCFWSPPAGSSAAILVFAVEVKAGWSDLVPQVGTYAHAMFMSSPLRSFSLVLGYNTQSNAFRFMLFHHGGITSSKDLHVSSNNGRLDVIRILARILLWETWADAGIPAFTNGVSFCLPRSATNPEEFVLLWTQKVLYHALCLRGRNTFVARVGSFEPKTLDLRPMTHTTRDDEPPPAKKSRIEHLKPATTDSAVPLPTTTTTTASPATCDEPLTSLIHPRSFADAQAEFTTVNAIFAQDVDLGLDTGSNFIIKCTWPAQERAHIEADMYKECAGEFGCPAFGCSFPALFPDGRPVTNTIYLPEDSDISSRHWKIGRSPQPDYVDKRSLQVTVLLEEGQSLETCKDPADMVLSVGHALLGYTVALLKGWMHRDISIGNILRLEKECDRKPFSAKSVIDLLRTSGTQDDAGESAITWESIGILASADANKQALVLEAKALERALETLEISTKCCAVWTDGDMAANLNGYFDRERNKSQVSGTKEFMSRRMREAMRAGKAYFHGPLDDLESFFWTMLWATMNHTSTRNSTAEAESMWRSDSRSSEVSMRGGVKESYFEAEIDETYSPMVRGMRSFLESWSSKIRLLQREAHSIVRRLPASSGHDGNAILDTYKSFFFRGVAEYFDLVVEYREDLGLPA
ncbi:hypothetical protein CYLTODRAFT_457351 [Cylindrobasidium torrendii FP15055 ss-10]|uniref:Fungal-type protein kinase domain-containing protein n=1 Tax=Cylindrobasidium torrendii FP15055 ss-10 TaxID=1314674 RepID=A0A0D7B447_9AGAR|nr:hypothetical protein CYLTODRAFT_457351 [Cylindrobasidium torrendii FP15055 ss-10]